MNFLIVVPRYVPLGEIYVFPIGMAYICSNMKKHGFEVQCLNLNHHEGNVSELVGEYILANHIDVMSGRKGSSCRL